MSLKISIQEARSLAVTAQRYVTGVFGPEGAKALTQSVIDQVGYIQIDTISVVQRAHHHSLWNRNRLYQESQLDELQAKDRSIFEYWGHAASYLPMTDYRFYLPRMQSFIDPKNKWFTVRLGQCKNHLVPVLQTIREGGPKSTRDFESQAGVAGGWWEWKPAKVALEVLYWQGELMISHRQGFQKVYDLPERVLPAGLDTRAPNSEELNRFLAQRALRAHALVCAEDIARFLFGGDKVELESTLQDMAAEGQVKRVEIAGPAQKGRKWYAEATALERLSSAPNMNKQIVFLSPFDNLVINRERISRLFDFDYTIECYVPAAKRRFGYFSLPILYGVNLIGRMDAKADRKRCTLIIHNLAFEENFVGDEAFDISFSAALNNFARFNACEKIQFGHISPNKFLHLATG